MVIRIAEYTVKNKAIDDVIKVVEVFVRAVNENEPNTFYEAFRKGGSLDFVHIMKFFDEISEKKHANASYTGHL